MMPLIDICEGSRFSEDMDDISSSGLQDIYAVSDINLSICYWEVFDAMIPLMMQWLPAALRGTPMSSLVDWCIHFTDCVCVQYWFNGLPTNVMTSLFNSFYCLCILSEWIYSIDYCF